MKHGAPALKELLAGAELVLQDDETLECFRFHASDDRVAATLCTRGGPVCSPLLNYRISDDSKVWISDHHSKVFIWEKVELADGVVTVMCKERLKRFSYTISKKRERYLP